MTSSAPSDAAVRLSEHLASLVGPDGRVRCPPRSRALESVLAWQLLKRSPRHPEARARLSRYLASTPASASPTPFDRLLLAAALGTGAPDAGAEDVLAGFTHHTAARKRILADTVLYLAGARRTLPERPAEAFAGQGLHSWKRPELAACRIVHAQAAGRARAVPASELARLDRLVSGARIHERNHLSHLLYLSALAPYPGHRTAVERGIGLLTEVQAPDGGFSLSTGADTWVTSVVALALAESGTAPASVARACSWLTGRQQADGGWSFGPGVSQTDVDTAYSCLKLLHLTGPARHTRALDRGHNYLLATQNVDGGWPVYLRGNPSEPAMTGGAISALADRPERHHQAVVRAVDWLTARQHADGTFERGWSLAEANAVFRAVQGLRNALDRIGLPAPTASAARAALSRAADFLHRSQNPDGGFGHRIGDPSDPISTGFSLAALAHLCCTTARAAARGYLHREQNPVGGFTSAPDTVSPRPFPLDLPALAPAYVLRGLTYDAARPSGDPVRTADGGRGR